MNLDAEIKRINKMILPAGHRADLVRRARTIAQCLSEPDAPPLDGVWCGRCGYALKEHDRLNDGSGP